MAKKTESKKSAKESEGLETRKVVATNRKAFFEYHVLDKLEAGLKLNGNEVKSLRAGQCVISDAYAMLDKKKSLAWLLNLQIPEWNRGNQIDEHQPKRKRALLLHKLEIKRLRAKLQEKGFTLIPLSIYFLRGWAKVELGICKGKKQHDKRQSIKEKEAKREIARRVKR